ncbi:MAG: dihydrofolate reductase family protein [Candidatus Omnitrophica bacterium]|nr:dihydrofolate reductase family protein [Candidatus Omnitrophota bacterium]
MAEHEISSILVEGGSMLNGTCFDDGIVDKVYFFIAPKIIGGKKAVNAIGGQGVADVKKAVLLSNVTVTKLNGDVLVEGNVKYRV